MEEPKKINKNILTSKKFLIICAVVAIIIIVATTVLALFTAELKDEAKINVGNLDVILVEDWPEGVPDEGIDRNDKNVKGRSIADKNAYVRMRFIPVVEYYYEETEDGQEIAEWRTAPIQQGFIVLDVDTKDKWVKQGDYYYYKDILEPNQDTEEMHLSWEVIEIPSTISKYKIRTDVRVLLEYSQVSNEMWKSIFQIDNLPEGVEQ